MPKTKLQYEQIKDERRTQILNVALKLFCSVGFEGTKIDDIAKQAKISHGLLYHYFAAKEDIFLELLRSSHCYYCNFGSDILEKDKSAKDLLDDIIRNAVEKIDKDENFCMMLYFALNINLIKRDFKALLKCKLKEGNSLAEFSNVKDSLKTSLKLIVQKGKEDGSLIDIEPIELETIFWSIIQGLTTNKMLFIRHNFEFKMPNYKHFVKIFIKEEGKMQ